MMGPKKKMNGYLLFALDKKRQEDEESGKKTLLPMDQILNKFDQAWSVLPEAEKLEWKNLAKTKNNRQPAVNRSRSRDWGIQPTLSSKQFNEIPIPTMAPAKEVKIEARKVHETKTKDSKIILESKEEKLKQIDPMLLDFLGKGQDYEEFAEQEFLLINFNNYEDCIPGELGMASFSINKGITFDGYRIIEPKEIRSRTEEILRSMETLKLPDPVELNKNSDSDKLSDDKMLKLVKACEIDDYQRVLRTIRKALQQTNSGRDKKFMNICFATSDHVKKVVGTIEWLKNASNSHDFELLVFPLEDLMIALSSKRRPGTADPFQSKFVATYLLTHDLRFKGYMDLACTWHRQKNIVDFVSVCALHKCRSQIYLLLQTLAPIFGKEFIEPTSPKIIPPTQDFIPKYGESKEAWEAQETKRRERIQKEIEKNRERQENMDKIRRQNATAEQHFQRLRVAGDRIATAASRGLTLTLVDVDNGEESDDDNKKRRYVLAFHDKNDPSKMHAFPREGSSSLPGLVAPLKIVDDNAKKMTAAELRKERSRRNIFSDEDEENNN